MILSGRRLSWLASLFVVLPLLGVLLASCGGSGAEYRLSMVLPSPAVPGEKVVAYGVFAAGARVRVGDAVMLVTPVGGGLQFVLPEWVVAGAYDVTVSGSSKPLTAPLKVLPRVDGVTLSDGVLTVLGAGWPTSPDSGVPVSVSVDGQALTPVVSAGKLVAQVGSALPYGAMTVTVVVGGVASAPYSEVREAAAVTGVVSWPAVATASLQGTPATQAVEPAALSTRLVVRHAPGVLGEFGREWEARGLRSRSWSPALGASLLVFRDVSAAEAARAALAQVPGVRSVRFDQRVDVSDGGVVVSGAPPASPGAGQWHLPLLGVEEAWRRTRGESVVVAVVDTGVDLAHPDLVGNLLPGYDFVDGDASPQDYAGHGTHVAGLAVAHGLALGTAPGASLLPVRVLDGDSGGSAFTVAQGILWAAGLMATPSNPTPAQVINLSLGTTGYSEALADAVRRALDAGVIVVAATGNTGGSVTYPAALPGVVAVTGLAGPLVAYQPWYANWGPGTWVTAYGGDLTQDQDGDGVLDGILSTDLGGYGLRMGTSMAAPQVAGLAALALAAGSPAGLVRDTLAGTTTDLGVMGYDERFGYGLATGRAGDAGSPRTYVVALDSGGGVASWTVVQADGSYTLASLAPGESLTVLALSDEDGDGVVGESGELASAPVAVTLSAGAEMALGSLVLNPTDGSEAVPLEPRP